MYGTGGACIGQRGIQARSPAGPHIPARAEHMAMCVRVHGCIGQGRARIGQGGQYGYVYVWLYPDLHSASGIRMAASPHLHWAHRPGALRQLLVLGADLVGLDAAHLRCILHHERQTNVSANGTLT